MNEKIIYLDKKLSQYTFEKIPNEPFNRYVTIASSDDENKFIEVYFVQDRGRLHYEYNSETYLNDNQLRKEKERLKVPDSDYLCEWKIPPSQFDEIYNFYKHAVKYNKADEEVEND